MESGMSAVSRETRSLPSNIAMQVEQRLAGKRKHVRHGGLLCSGCLNKAPLTSGRYCRECRNARSAEAKKREREELKRLRAQVEGNAGGQGKA
jgi:predicted amidophosphoribosyltransferase